MKQRKPAWLKVKIASGSGFKQVLNQLHSAELHTVCEEANCPNLTECWNRRTATFLVLGKACTRNCSFCAVRSAKKGESVNHSEPQKIAKVAKKFKLRYVVLTSVDRDDLPDFGAGHFAECISAVKKSGAKVEALIPDFQGNAECLQKVVAAKPDVLGHNIEVVERLQGIARDTRASYSQSFGVLRKAKELDSSMPTKSSLMLGLGEEREEVLSAMDDLLEAGVDLLTLGQYLQPSKSSLPVQRFVKPSEFAELGQTALEKGFKGVFAGPLVRSSYRAGELLERQLSV